MYVTHLPDEISFDKVGIKGKIFPTNAISNAIEFVLVDTQAGHETKIIEHKSTFYYYVLSGDGYFEVDGQKEDCSRGDLVVIPPGKAFIYKGRLKLLLVNTPVWDEDQEETVE